MRYMSLWLSLATAYIYPTFCMASSEVNTLYKQDKNLTSNVESVQDKGHTNFIYCEEGPNLVTVNSSKKNKIALNKPCSLIVKELDTVYTFHGTYIKLWRSALSR